MRQQTISTLQSPSHQAAMMLKHEGGRSFFRGLSYPLWTNGILNSLYFGFYANSLKTMENMRSEKHYRNCCDYGQVYRKWHWDCFWAGCIGGVASTLVNTPIELAKTVLQAHTSKQQNQTKLTPTSCLLDLFRKRGFSGCYHGGLILLIRDVPTFGLYAVCYEHIACHLKTNFSSTKRSVRILYEGIAGGLSGVITWFLALPIDVIKSRYMLDCQNINQRKYSGIVDCIQKTYSYHGLAVFYRGLSVAMIRAFPVNLLCFVTYEQTLRFL